MVLQGLDAFSGHRDTWRTRLHVRVGSSVEENADLAAEVDADLLVSESDHSLRLSALVPHLSLAGPTW